MALIAPGIAEEDSFIDSNFSQHPQLQAQYHHRQGQQSYQQQHHAPPPGYFQHNSQPVVPELPPLGVFGPQDVENEFDVCFGDEDLDQDKHSTPSGHSQPTFGHPQPGNRVLVPHDNRPFGNPSDMAPNLRSRSKRGASKTANVRPAPASAKLASQSASGNVQKGKAVSKLDAKTLSQLDPAVAELFIQGMQNLESRNAELEKKHLTLMNNNDYNQVDIKQVVTLNISEGMEAKVIKAVIRILFRNVKFVTDQGKSKALALHLVDYVHDQAELKHMTEAYRESFAVTYMNLVDLTISHRRNHVQQEVRKVIQTLMGSGGEDEPDTDLAPTIELMLKCAHRDIDVNNADELRVFMWYWEHILSKAGGESMWFREEYKYKVLPSNCTYQFEDFDQDFKLFTAATEAFLVIVFENCIDKWKAQCVWKHEHPGENLPTKTKINKGEALHKTKYTITDIGQQKYGGWSDAGLARFNAIKTSIKASRKNDIQVDIVDPETGNATPTRVKRYLFVEKKALEEFQKVHKKDEPEEGTKKRKRDLASKVDVELDLDD